jgi:hypothetical protein
MNNATATNPDVMVINPYHIAIRPTTKVQVLRDLIVNFVKGLILYLDLYEKQRLAIHHDAMLSPEGRTTAMQKLQGEYGKGLVKFLTDAENMVSSFRKNLSSIILGGLGYVWDPSPVVEMMKRVEAREMLGKLNDEELAAVLFDETTSDLIFYSILTAPMPMMRMDIMKQGVDIRIKRIAPDILDYREGALEVSASVSRSLTSAYGYLGLTVPRPIKADLPDFLDILSKWPVTKG